MIIYPKKQVMLLLLPIVLTMFTLSLLLAFGATACGSSQLGATEPSDIECKILNAWDFKRCENKEVVCYTNEQGLSCKWK